MTRGGEEVTHREADTPVAAAANVPDQSVRSATERRTKRRTLRILTINVNVLTVPEKLEKIEKLLLKNRADIAVLQEVAVTEFNFRDYAELVNKGDNNRGTAILWRRGLRYSTGDVSTLKSGRASAVTIEGVRIVNVYAPSGGQGHRERNSFFSNDVPKFFEVQGLGTADLAYVLVGDFNCCLYKDDTTGCHISSWGLGRLLDDKCLADTWRHLKGDAKGYTCKSKTKNKPNGETRYCQSRLDRLYVCEKLLGGTKSAKLIDTLSVYSISETDRIDKHNYHKALIVKIKLPGEPTNDDATPPSVTQGAGYSPARTTSSSSSTERSSAGDHSSPRTTSTRTKKTAIVSPTQLEQRPLSSTTSGASRSDANTVIRNEQVTATVKKDRTGRWHGPNGRFVKKADVELLQLLQSSVGPSTPGAPRSEANSAIANEVTATVKKDRTGRWHGPNGRVVEAAHVEVLQRLQSSSERRSSRRG